MASSPSQMDSVPMSPCWDCKQLRLKWQYAGMSSLQLLLRRFFKKSGPDLEVSGTVFVFLHKSYLPLLKHYCKQGQTHYLIFKKNLLLTISLSSIPCTRNSKLQALSPVFPLNSKENETFSIEIILYY